MSIIVKPPTPVQRTRARSLRRDQTDAERRLWSYLRNRQVCGAKFRRQLAISHYIVDFCCLEIGLIIELDGGQHAKNEELDHARTRDLEARGFVVMRFWNNEVLRDTESAVERIRTTVELRRKSGRRYGTNLLARLGKD